MSTLAVGTIKSISSAAPVFQNTSGTEIGQICKSWINFDGVGTVSIRDSFNVSSLTDNGTGNYTVTFTNAMSNTNYCALTTGHIQDDSSPENVRDMGAQDLATSSYRFCAGFTTGSLQDCHMNFGAVFGD